MQALHAMEVTHPGESHRYFFTLITHRRQRVLTRSSVRSTLFDIMRTVGEELPFEIDAWVLMPDHLHCIWTVPIEMPDCSERWNLITQRSSRQLQRSELEFWERRYWQHRLVSEADYQQHRDYIHYNPVRHGLVEHVADWRYSSFHYLVQRGEYAKDWRPEREFEGSYGE